MKPISEADRKATQESALLMVLVNYTNKPLTPDLIDIIMEDLKHETQKGPMSWAFKQQST